MSILGWKTILAEGKVESIKSLYSLELADNEAAFIFLGYSGILLRSKSLAIAFDPSKNLSQDMLPRSGICFG